MSYVEIGTIRTLTVKGLTLTIEHVYDDDPDYSYLGEFTDYHTVSDRRGRLVHAATESILGYDDIWRDVNGRIVADPHTTHPYDFRRGNREYQFTYHDNYDLPVVLKYVLQDHKRLMDYARDHWYYVGIVVTLSHTTPQGYYKELSQASLWGIESDCGDSYISEVTRELIAECLSDARQREVA